METLVLPERVQYLLSRLEAAGYGAYAVGGCVRDTLLGRTPEDWDLCTSALPEETERCFQDLRVAETGLRHGTVTVILEGQPFEITTFRQDGAYVDHRRPEQVRFVTSLTEDLRRRDFTVNAMAVGLDGILRDPFGGREDLAAGRLRCVGDPDRRFEEDALRILRAMRFSARLGFSVEARTAEAMERRRDLLHAVSGERVYRELTGILVGNTAVLGRFQTVLAEVLPEILPAVGFLQQNPHHRRDVWGHTLEALGYSRPDPLVRWTLLCHDLGKPDCFTVDRQGVGHFYGHPARSAELAEGILRRLHADRETIETVRTLVACHDSGAPAERKNVRRWIGRFGPDTLLRLLEVQRADCLAHVMTPRAKARYENVMRFAALTRQVLREERCFSVRDLEVRGEDVLALGVQPGPEVGQLLQCLLTEVLEERCPNQRPALLARLSAIYQERTNSC